jgi:Bacterial SH3 domain
MSKRTKRQSPSPVAKRRFGCVRWFFYGVIGMLALVGCGVIANIVSPQTADQPERAAVVSLATSAPTLTATNTPAPVVAQVDTPATSTQAPTSTPAPTHTPLPTNTAPPIATPTSTATPAPTATPVVAIFGSEMSAWTARYGTPITRFGYQVFGDWEVLPMPGNRVRHMERVYDPPTTLTTARTDVAIMLPSDATFARSYSPDQSPEILVDLYESPILASNLPSDAWVNAEPGQFTVLYFSYPEGVSRVVIASGNNVTNAQTEVLPTATTPPTSPAANSNANLRAGPGTEYDIMGNVDSGAALDIVGQNAAGDWLQLASGLWIAASLANNTPPGLPVTAVAIQAPPSPVPTQYTGWQKEDRGYTFRSECECNQGDILNCGDFGSGMDAQACYLKCMEETGRDVHGMDRDKDTSACEWKY